jgi:predicted nucleotidyltransferase
MPTKRLDIDDAALAAFCRKHRVVRLALFGSVLTGRDRADSDVDLLVEFEPGGAPGLVGLAGMEAELSALLGGRRVDLRTPKDLSRYFREDVIRHAEVQFAR